MIHIPRIIKYILRVILGFFVVSLFAGAVVYRFDIPAYISYLNTRSITDVSLTNPVTLIHLFVPSSREDVPTLDELLAGTGVQDSTGDTLNIDPDFEGFFSDFSQSDTSSAIVTGEDFGFTSQDLLTGSGTQMTEDQQAVFLERLREREVRLQQQADLEMMGTGMN